MTSGRGPAECCWVVAQVVQCIVEGAASAGLRAKVLEAEPGDESATLKSALVAVEGDSVVDFLRASGPGGQHVNRTETAVRITHLPTGLSATAQEERSKHLNRKLAMARLFKILQQRGQNAEDQSRQERWLQHNELERGNPIHVYRGRDFRSLSK